MEEKTCRMPVRMQFVVQNGVMSVNDEATVWADVPVELLAQMFGSIMPDDLTQFGNKEAAAGRRTPDAKRLKICGAAAGDAYGGIPNKEGGQAK